MTSATTRTTPTTLSATARTWLCDGTDLTPGRIGCRVCFVRLASLPYDMNVARARIERVFRYLQELHRIRTPPVLDVDRYEWILRLDTLPRHAVIQRGFDLGADASGANRGFILSIERPA